MDWVVIDDVEPFGREDFDRLLHPHQLELSRRFAMKGKLPVVPASTPSALADVANRILPAVLRERERASWAWITGMDWAAPEFDWAAQARVGHAAPKPRVGEFGFRDPERARQLSDLVDAAAALYRVHGDLRARAALRDRFIREMRAGHVDPQPLSLGRPTVRPQHRGGA